MTLATSLLVALAGQATPAAPSAAALEALDPTRLGRLACRGVSSRATLEQRLRWAQALADQQPGNAAPGLAAGVAASDLPLGAVDPLARRYFEQGLALAYGFNHKAAIRSFRLAQARAPDCALCWWGEALANGPNINAGMDDAANRAALAALERARALAPGAEPLAQALIAAQSARYSAAPGADRAALDAAYADAMLRLAADHPGGDDLAVLAAEAAMNTTPWNYWAEGGAPRARIAEAVALVERVMARSPHHPQASHLYIHLLELPDPERAEAAADRLAESGPAALGHLVHMPSHIYYRIGRYRDSMAANVAAARADERYLAEVGDDGLYRFGYYPHNVHFLLTSAQMMGDAGLVATHAQRLSQVLNEEIARELPWVQAIHAAPSFAQAQYGSPQAVLATTATPSPLAYVEAMRRYARAVAYARSGEAANFARERAALAALVEDDAIVAMGGAGFPAADLVRLATAVADGRHAYARGDYRAAAVHYRAAIALEKGIPYSEPPFWYYPVSQSLGAALYASGDYAGARDAFRAALFAAPNSGFALYGLAQAERRLGHRPEAAAAEAALDKLWVGDRSWLRMDRI